MLGIVPGDALTGLSSFLVPLPRLTVVFGDPFAHDRLLAEP
jgi:hypothetical protein